ncbi:MAG: Fpg/Nei family DNA glycosylase [Acidimicrobiales bacterium]
MPEGDTLFRTAATLNRWLAGREVTWATTTVEGLPAGRLVGQTVDVVEARGKHLLIRLDSGQVLHSHLRMTGSWHVYRKDEDWRRPRTQARLALACGDHVAVCFNAPVVELLAPRVEAVHPGLINLGPDILVDPLDLDEIRHRARACPPDLPLGELLLDQHVVAGIGNIYRCEALFLEGHGPWTPRSSLTDGDFDRLVTTASQLMKAQLSAQAAARAQRWVYGRAGRPCRRCGTRIQARRQGEQARVAYWCLRCQR